MGGRSLNVIIRGLMDSRCGEDTLGQTKRQGRCFFIVEDCAEKEMIRICQRLERKSCSKGGN